MVSAAKTMVIDLRRRWMRWVTVVTSCCDDALIGNNVAKDFLVLLLLLLCLDDNCMFSRVLEFIDIVDAHLFVTDEERALIRGDDDD